MSGIATAIGASAVLGTAGAVYGANQASKGAKTAANATRDATRAQIDANNAQYNQTREDFTPFRNLAPESLATLQSSVYGRPVNYQSANYRLATPEDIAKANYDAIKSGQYTGDLSGFYHDVNNGENPIQRLIRDNNQWGIYSGSKDWYVGPDGQLLSPDKVPQSTAQGQQFDLANFKPEGTAAYEWQKSKTLEDLGNYFNLVGRGKGSTVQSNATARSLGDLNAAEYEKGYNRLFNQKQDYINNLLNLVKTSQGAAGSTAASGMQSTGNISSALGQQGNTLASLANQQGQTQANLYSGIVPSAMNTVGTGLQVANYMNQGGKPFSTSPVSAQQYTDQFGGNVNAAGVYV